MKNYSLMWLWLFVLPSWLVSQEAKTGHLQSEATLSLNDGWMLQSSGKVDERGEVLSTTTFQPKGWHVVTVPTTVFSALVKHKVYPDPYFGMNLRSVPGVTYPIGANFSNI